jgi:glycerol-3-phosphate O-acyltransferase
MIDAFMERGLLARAEGGLLRRPPVTTPEFATLSGLGLILRETLERYCMSAVLLADNLAEGGVVDRAEFEQQCHLMAQRMAILSGRNAPEFFDKTLFSNFIDTLKALDLVNADPEAGDRRLAIDRRVEKMAADALLLLSVEVQQRIRRLISHPRRPQPAAAEMQHTGTA